MLVITNGRIFDPGHGVDQPGELLVKEGKIESVGTGVSFPSSAPMIDAKGLIISPGFVDLHCHLREPGFEEEETIASGTQAAAVGGFTTVCCMPNTDPPVDSKSIVNWIKKRASESAVVNVLPIGCITKGRKGKEVCDMAELAEAGVVAFSDDGDSVPDSQVMCHAMDYSRDFDLPLIEHCEDKFLTNGGVINEGWVADRLGLKGIPAAAEEIIIARDLALARLTGAKLHIAHVSTRGAVELIRHAKRNGVPVTAEVTPHHLTLTQERIMNMSNGGGQLKYDSDAKVYPPLRTQDDIDALLEGLKEGVLDAIATDHAPHTQAQKKCELELAAFGISGFEAAFGSLMGLLHAGKIDLGTLISKLTCEPARVIGRGNDLGTLRVGAMANIVIFDVDREWQVDRSRLVSKGKNTPFDGCWFKGKVLATIVNGEILYQDDSVRVNHE